MLYAKNRRKKGISIRTKVVAWFAVFVVLIALLAIVVVLYVTRNSLWAENEDELREEVTEFARELRWSGDNVWAEDSYYEDDIVFSVYNDSGVCIGGIVPDSFSRDTVLKNGQVQQISSGEHKWMTYDIALDNGENGYIWVRGITHIGWGSLSLNGIFILSLVAFPVLIALAVAGGCLITQRAFAPVEYIRTTAEKIAGSGDLTQRVPTGNTGGELQELADTFNGMLDALQQSFEDEKQFTADG
ncbi:MAG: HAMP domain-containing protein [Clostridia bacterium]|nr:HAMP domain-containing protein [Clostridia bacterium]